MDQNDQVDGARLRLGAAQHRLSLKYDADQLDQPPPILFFVALYSISR